MKKILGAIGAVVFVWVAHLVWHALAGAGIVALWNEWLAPLLNAPSLSAWQGILGVSVLCVPALLGVGCWHGKRKQRKHCEKVHHHSCHCDEHQKAQKKEEKESD